MEPGSAGPGHWQDLFGGRASSSPQVPVAGWAGRPIPTAQLRPCSAFPKLFLGSGRISQMVHSLRPRTMARDLWGARRSMPCGFLHPELPPERGGASGPPEGLWSIPPRATCSRGGDRQRVHVRCLPAFHHRLAQDPQVRVGRVVSRGRRLPRGSAVLARREDGGRGGHTHAGAYRWVSGPGSDAPEVPGPCTAFWAWGRACGTDPRARRPLVAAGLAGQGWGPRSTEPLGSAHPAWGPHGCWFLGRNRGT